MHFLCAATFILGLAAIAFVFARREQRFEGDVRMARFQRLCGVHILLAVAWVIIGGRFSWNIGSLTPLYVGEVVSVWAFAASWLVKGKDLRRVLG